MQQTAELLERELEKYRKLEKNLAFRFSIVNKMLEQQASDLLAETPLKLTGFRILKIIETFDALSVSDVSRHMMFDRAQISRSVVQLAELGLVEFKGDSRSKLKKIVVLSDKGRELMLKLNPIFEKRQSDIEAALGSETLSSVWDAISKLSRHLDIVNSNSSRNP
ncbi:MAG: MarR family winged helix-turn-helix transcriptional regulator [Rhizobiaceae bacterium]